jgi:hypothetical protein
VPRCVAPGGSETGADERFPERRPTQGFFFLISRINKSVLSLYGKTRPLCDKAGRFVTEHGRMSMAAGTADGFTES